ncbi:MAG: DNA repair protein RAD51-like protein 3-like protein [Benjaminiella poitrasii]|nr:MAG: DNA repair protein RAD51-like protein 3-like protein [Benjaminiella poitrasii]
MSLSEIITLPSLRKKLEDAGYQSLEEIKKESVYDLTQELQLTKEEVKSLIKISDKETKLKRTFGELLTAEKEYSISTSSKSFDKLLGDGVPPFKITEVCGESGSGKSQICMQLAVNVQLPKEEGGANGECIYIDTESSFESSRIVSMASKYDVEKILKGIHLFRVHDHAELMALIRQLPDILKEYPNTRLIVIDSIAYHFRLNTLDSRTRSIILDYIAQSLIEVAHINTLAVIVSNHVTTDGMDMTWTPSLGSSWGYWCAKRLFVSRKREFRYGYLYKSVENAGSRPVQFCIRVTTNYLCTALHVCIWGFNSLRAFFLSFFRMRVSLIQKKMN